MRKWMTLVLLALAMLAACTLSLAEGEGSVVQSSCSVVQSGDYYLVYCYAQIHNNTDKVICLERGTFELHSGEQLLASQEVEKIWPGMIAPGGEGYAFGVVAFEPDENGEPVVPHITGLTYDIEYMAVDAAFASIDLPVDAQIERDASGGMSVLCTVHNDTAADAFGAAVTFGLYTDGGAMVYADGMTLRSVGVPAGDSVIVRFALDDAIVDQWNAYGANITQVRAAASYRDGTD